ncbi:hypothetical protein K1719_000238 [Acacia pycnantha]|nr:hypothetical protein K1719_000238 [Acacia pycnantha]
MGKLGRILDTFCLSPSSSSSSSSCFCVNSMEIKEYENEMKPLVATTESSDGGQKLRLKDVVAGRQTLAFQLKPKVVILKVSMHCDGCAKRVEKHVSKLEGVSSYKVDLENKRVVLVGDILPLEVLESMSKVNKYAELCD